MRRGRSTHDADDLVQEAWVRLACYEPEVPVNQPEAMLMQIALRLSINKHRMQKSHGEEVLLDDVDLVDMRPDADEVLLARERAARLSLCVGRLGRKTRAVFLAARVEELSYQEIAERHGLSVRTVEKHIAKATMQLTDWMEGW